VTVDGMPIQHLQQTTQKGSEIRYSRDYECREAARFAHASWREFQRLSQVEKAQTLAHFRLKHMIDATIMSRK